MSPSKITNDQPSVYNVNSTQNVVYSVPSKLFLRNNDFTVNTVNNSKNAKCTDTDTTYCSHALNCFFTNARGLRSKHDLLQEYAIEQNLDIIGIAETFLTDDILSAEIALPGYTMYRKDRCEVNNSKGGGVVLYVRNDIISCEIVTLNQLKCESVWCKLKTHGNPDVIVGVCYKSQAAADEEIENMAKAINMVSKGTLLIMGDFNYPNIDWSKLEAHGNDIMFRDLILDNYLIQHVKEPTRDQNILDLIFTSHNEMVEKLQIAEHLGNSDHNIIMWKLIVAVNRISNKNCRKQYHKGKYNMMRNWIGNIEWNNVFGDLDINDKWTSFCNIITEAINLFIPVVEGQKLRFPKWLNREARNARKHKAKMWKQYKISQSNSDYLQYKKALNEATKQYKKAKKRFEHKIAVDISKNPRSFYAYVRSKTVAKEIVGPLRNADGELTSDDLKMSEILNTYFGSVFNKEEINSTMSEIKVKITNDMDKLTSVTVNKQIIYKKIMNLKPNKAPGVDGIIPRILIENAENLTEVLETILQESLQTGIVPLEWKKANVTAIFKKGLKELASNYRPISLTSHLCKIMESIIKDCIMKHLTDRSLINTTQHGFWPKRSCLTNLLEFLEYVTKYVDSGYPIDVIYLDFQKAFDKVPHQRLLQKIKALGIDGEIYAWIKNWLLGRLQRVVLNGVNSRWIPVTSGVPQGSVLGPLLFLIYINDIDESISSGILKFADDTKLYATVATKKEVAQLKEDLIHICNWSQEWLMLFNNDKCKVMHMGVRNTSVEYYMNGIKLEDIEEEQDLGIIVQNNLKCAKQCAKAVKQANKTLGIIKRTFRHLNQQILLLLFKSLVRPHLEYCVQAWRPHLQKDIDLIEGVQRRATKLIPSLKVKSYQDRLQILKLPTLENRRLRGDMIEVFKLLTGFTDVQYTKFFQLGSTLTRGHSLKLHKNACIHDFRKYFFSHRVIEVWNRLPEHVISSNSVNMFKNRYDNYVLNRGFI